MRRPILSFFLVPLSVLYHTVTAEASYELSREATINGRKFRRYKGFINNSEKEFTTKEWINEILYGKNDSSIKNLVRIMKSTPYEAFYFEVKPVTIASFDKDAFEFVLVDAPRLTKENANFRSFEKPCYKGQQDSFGWVFSNLSGDATLIVPKPSPEGDTTDPVYTHLANFVRGAREEQVGKMWKMVASTYEAAVNSLDQNQGSSRVLSSAGNQVLWLSTAGNGVPWLHFRLDTFPKYFRYDPFRIPVVESLKEEEL